MKLRVEYVHTGSITPYSGNAKRHPQEQIEQIKASIREFGFNDPIAVWHDEVVEGHGRLLAAEELGIDTLPIIRLDNLTDEQRRGYILAHNKLTMNSGFDPKLLAVELENLPGLDMEQFGFELPDLNEPDTGWYGDERERTNRAYNLDKIDSTELTNNFWQMPVIYKEDHKPRELIGFNYAKTYTDKSVGVHFFIDDYQFERIWNYPDRYIDELMSYDCVFSPDFSLYSDMPMPMKIWNVYRSRQIGAYLQSCGLKVIPTVSWAEPETYQFCFEGIEKGGTVAISTVGIIQQKEARGVWLDGVAKMIDVIEPSRILIYGNRVEFDDCGIETVYYENSVTKAWQNGR